MHADPEIEKNTLIASKATCEPWDESIPSQMSFNGNMMLKVLTSSLHVSYLQVVLHWSHAQTPYPISIYLSGMGMRLNPGFPFQICL